MSNYSTLKAAISAVIKENNNHEITGQVLQTTLLAMVDSLAGGYLFKGIATPATVVGTPDENVFYIGGGGLYSNFGATPVNVPDCCIGIFTYNGSFENHIIPTGGVFDISAYNAVGGTPATYANLQAALGTNGANIPEALRKGGMSVKFIQGSAPSSDNNYIQARLMADEFTTDVTQWAIAEESVIIKNPEFVYVKTDKDNKILWAIKKDGSIYYGAGVPQQVVDYINEKIAELSLDEYEDIVAFLNGLEEGDKTLQMLLNEKVDKEEGKSLIDSRLANGISYVSDNEFLEAKTDKDGKLIEGLKKDGTKVFNLLNILQLLNTVKLKIGGSSEYYIINNQEYLYAISDSKRHILFGIKRAGNVEWSLGIPEPIENRINEIVYGDDSDIINSLNKVINFLVGYKKSDNLRSIIESDIKSKLNVYEAYYTRQLQEYNESYHDCLGKYLNSYRLAQLFQNPYVDTKLSEKDSLPNSAGKTFYYDGYVYVLKYQNHIASGNGESEYLNLCKVSSTDPTDLTNIIAFDADEVLTFADTSSITITKAHEGGMIVDNDYIHVTTLIEYQDENEDVHWQMVHKKFNTSDLSQVGLADKCWLLYNNVSYNFNLDDIPSELVGTWHDIVFNAGIKKHGDYYYGAFSTTMHTKTGILRTQDFVSWDWWYTLPSELSAYGEVGIMSLYDNPSEGDNRDYILLSLRTYMPTYLIKLRISNKTIVEKYLVKGNCSMATLFNVGKDIYMLCTGRASRYYYKFIKVDVVCLMNSYTICDTNGVRFGPNTVLSSDPSGYIYGCITGVNLKLCKFKLPVATQEECDNILNKLINL